MRRVRYDDGSTAYVDARRVTELECLPPAVQFREPPAHVRGGGQVFALGDHTTFTRVGSEETDMLLLVWSQIFEEQYRTSDEQGYPPGDLHDWGDEDVDAVRIFSGPTDRFGEMLRDRGMTAMPPIDKTAPIPYDLANDVMFSHLMVGLLQCRPALTIIEPCCTSWSKAMDLNMKNLIAVAQRDRDRDEQRRLMLRVVQICRAVATWHGHVMIENPDHSAFWRESFVDDIKKTAPPGHEWRDVRLNMCMAGGPHFKMLRFMTTVPASATSHMERTCDHGFKHPLCHGRDETGRSRTALTAAYTADLLMMLVGVVAILMASRQRLWQTFGPSSCPRPPRTTRSWSRTRSSRGRPTGRSDGSPARTKTFAGDRATALSATWHETSFACTGSARARSRTRSRAASRPSRSTAAARSESASACLRRSRSTDVCSKTASGRCPSPSQAGSYISD